jgi:hypothetical protein
MIGFIGSSLQLHLITTAHTLNSFRMNYDSCLTNALWRISLKKSNLKSLCDWRSVSQYVLVSSLIWGPWPDINYCVTVTVWREDGCCWPLPAQSFSGPSPLGLETIFYCPTFETSLFVASYDSQGHGGGIRPRLHTGVLSLNWNLLDWTSMRTEYTRRPLSRAVLLLFCVIRCSGN